MDALWSGSEIVKRYKDGQICRMRVLEEVMPYPIHPGEMLREDVLTPLGLNIAQLAHELKISASRLSQIVKGQRGISPDTSLRLARYLGCSDGLWLRLQARYDLEVARREHQKQIWDEVLPREASSLHTKPGEGQTHPRKQRPLGV